MSGLATDINSQFGLRFTPAEVASMSRAQMEEHILERLKKRYDEKEEVVGAEVMRDTERMIWLSVIDQQWKDHLLSMDHLKEGIGMRAYGQKDPLIEYKKEGFGIFQEMMDRIEDETIRFLFFLQPVVGERPNVPLPEDSWPDEDDEDGDSGEAQAAQAAQSEEDRKEAQASFVDLTRNIQKKKEREMEMLQFTGGRRRSDAGGPGNQGR
ncbi:MAG: hypothetical protein QM757_39925 [Paludibaculum sp.]